MTDDITPEQLCEALATDTLMNAPKPWDKYDYYEIAYRTILFLVISYASFFILSAFADLAKKPPVTGFAFILVTFYTLVWIVFEIGILAYLVFVAKGSFRPKPAIPEYEDEDDNEDGDDEPTIDITTEEIPDETPAIPESEINE